MSLPRFSFPGHVLLRTPRLALRQLTLSDTADLLSLGNDQQVVAHLLDSPINTAPQCDSLVLVMNLIYAFGLPRGLGNWRADDAEGHFIGLFSLMRVGESAEVEIGARLRSATWNQGYAIEGGLALCHYAFAELKLPTLVGFCDPHNVAVPSVLRRLGFDAAGATSHFGRPALRFTLTRQQWLDRDDS